MPLRKADGPLTVHVPPPGADRPSWMGVGAIAVAGFVIGVAWPRLAGIRLGPRGDARDGRAFAGARTRGGESGRGWTSRRRRARRHLLMPDLERRGPEGQ